MGNAGIALDKTSLKLDLASHGVDHASKFENAAVAGPLHDPSIVRGNRRIDEVSPQASDPGKRSFLVRSHEAAESDDIRDQYGRKFS